LRRITKAALGGLAGCALVLGGTQVASSASLLKELFSGNLVDLDTDGQTTAPLTIGAFDSAEASLKVTETSDGGTTFWIRVKGIDLAFAGQTFGSHLHTGSCAIDNPGGAGGHYQHADPDLTSLREKEVWFDIVPNEEGVAVDRTVAPFVPKDNNGVDDGVMSIVIHAKSTNPDDGSAGAREVCLPLDVTTWGPDLEPSPVETP
jgi:hypothetical protein